MFSYWLNEYNIDGYRFDLSKGFTQNNTLGDVGAWGAYDGRADRYMEIHCRYAVGCSTRMLFSSWNILQTILEEKELANYGFMLWAT